MSAHEQLTRDVDVDLGGIFGSVWRHKGKLLLASLLAAALAFVLVQMMAPRYQAEARILIRASEPVLARPDQRAPLQTQDLDDPAIASQVELLQSRTVALKVIEGLGLKRLPEFDATLSPNPLAGLLSRFGLADTAAASAEDRVLGAYYSKLKVFQSERSRVIVVQFSSEDPKLAAAVPNAVADAYLRMQEELKRGAGPAELAKIQPEIDALRAKVVEAEAAVADYRSSTDLFDGRDEQSLATQELSEISTELGRVRAQRSRAEANADAVARALSTGALDSVPSVIQSPLIQRLRERQATLDAQLSDLSTTLLPGHPRVKRLRSQIESLDGQVRREVGRIADSLRREVSVAQRREQDLVQRRNQLKAEAGRVERDQVELRALEREATAQRELLNAYLVRFKEATSRQSREYLPADAYVFARARVPAQAYFPKKLPILVGAFFGTLLLGAMVAIAGAVLSGAGGGATAHQRRHPNLGGADGIDPELEEAIRMEVAQAPPLQPSMGDLTAPVPARQPNGAVGVAAAARSATMLGRGRIAVLDPTGTDGAVTAVAFARLLSANGASVMLVDLGNGGTATSLMLGDTRAVGLRDVLSGGAQVSDAIHSDSASSAHVMPMGVTPVEELAGMNVNLGALLKSLTQSYAFLVLECGSADMSGLARVSDASTVTLLAAPDPAAQEIALTVELMQQTGKRVPLVVSSLADERRAVGLQSA